jgi:hypothetical protein
MIHASLGIWAKVPWGNMPSCLGKHFLEGAWAHFPKETIFSLENLNPFSLVKPHFLNELGPICPRELARPLLLEEVP